MSAATTHGSDPAWVVLDVETTGLSPREHRIVELAVVILDYTGKPLGEASTLLDPGDDLGSIEAHGIRPEHLAGAPRFGSIAGWLQQWLAGKVVVGHNLLFTTAFLDEEYRRVGISMPHVPVICTMTHAPRYLPSLPGRTLEQCCAAAGIPIVGERSALSRARAASALFGRFLTHRETLPSPWVDNLAKARKMAWPQTPVRDFPLVNRPALSQPATIAPAEGFAPVSGGAQVSGSAPVSGGTPVTGGARVSGGAQVSGSAAVPVARPVTGTAKVGARPSIKVGPGPRPSPRPRPAKPADADPAHANPSYANPAHANAADAGLASIDEAAGGDQVELVADMVDNAPRQPDESGAVGAYLGALDTAVSDRILSFTEAIHLKDLASALAIFEAEQAEAHRTYLRTLASTAWSDHKLTEAERTDLLTVGKLLEVSEDEVDEAIADTMPRRPARAKAGTAGKAASAGVAAVPSAESPALAAWYPDPYGNARLRWWDGNVWTSHLHD